MDMVRAVPDGNQLLIEVDDGGRWMPVARLEIREVWVLFGQINDWLHPPMFD